MILIKLWTQLAQQRICYCTSNTASMIVIIWQFIFWKNWAIKKIRQDIYIQPIIGGKRSSGSRCYQYAGSFLRDVRAFLRVALCDAILQASRARWEERRTRFPRERMLYRKWYLKMNSATRKEIRNTLRATSVINDLGSCKKLMFDVIGDVFGRVTIYEGMLRGLPSKPARVYDTDWCFRLVNFFDSEQDNGI